MCCPRGRDLSNIRFLAEAGVDISAQTSKPIDLDLLNTADLVVTLCGDATESCPVTPPTVHRLHWPLTDPTQATGTEEEILAAFRAARDEIKRRVEELLPQI